MTETTPTLDSAVVTPIETTAPDTQASAASTTPEAGATESAVVETGGANGQESQAETTQAVVEETTTSATAEASATPATTEETVTPATSETTPTSATVETTTVSRFVSEAQRLLYENAGNLSEIKRITSLLEVDPAAVPERELLVSLMKAESPDLKDEHLEDWVADKFRGYDLDNPNPTSYAGLKLAKAIEAQREVLASERAALLGPPTVGEVVVNQEPNTATDNAEPAFVWTPEKVAEYEAAVQEKFKAVPNYKVSVEGVGEIEVAATDAYGDMSKYIFGGEVMQERFYTPEDGAIEFAKVMAFYDNREAREAALVKEVVKLTEARLVGKLNGATTSKGAVFASGTPTSTNLWGQIAEKIR